MEPTPNSTTGSTSNDLKGKAQETAQQAKGKAQQAAQRFKDEGKQNLETRKETAAGKAEQLADAVNRASDELHQQHEDGLADYASQLASGITRLADNLRNRSIDELVTDTQTFARRNPTMFFLSSIGAGFALSRFLKASSRRSQALQGGHDTDDFEVSYDTGSEWQQPEASQSLYGGQPGDSAGDSNPARQGITPSSWTANAAGMTPTGGDSAENREPPFRGEL